MPVFSQYYPVVVPVLSQHCLIILLDCSRCIFGFCQAFWRLLPVMCQGLPFGLNHILFNPDVPSLPSFDFRDYLLSVVSRLLRLTRSSAGHRPSHKTSSVFRFRYLRNVVAVVRGGGCKRPCASSFVGYKRSTS